MTLPHCKLSSSSAELTEADLSLSLFPHREYREQNTKIVSPTLPCNDDRGRTTNTVTAYSSSLVSLETTL